MTLLSSFSIKRGKSGVVSQECVFKMEEIAVCVYTDGTLGLFWKTSREGKIGDAGER